MTDSYIKKQEQLMRLASYCSVGTALLLVVVKIISFFLTNSLAVLSSLMDSGLDLGASIVSMIAVRQALIPADKEHRFGHCKAEALGGFIQGVLIFLSACFLFFETIEHLVSPVKLEKLGVGIGVMLISIVVSVALIRFQHFVIKRTNSLSIIADNAHYTGDVIMNTGVIISMLFSYLLGWGWLDTVFAAVVCCYLFINSFGIIKSVSKVLMDEELPADIRKQIKQIVMENKDVKGVRDLRTRNAGIKSFIQFTILLDKNMNLTQAHELCTLLEIEVEKAITKCEVFIHAEPKEQENGTEQT